MAVIVNGDGILTGISSLATALTDITSGRGTITGVTTVGTLQLGTGVSMSSPRSQNAAIFTNNTEFFTVDDAGRVGVGTISPNTDAHPQNVGKINVGFITARSIAGDIDANTMVVAGISTFVGNLSIARDIIHTGDTDTFMRFDTDTVKFDTGGVTRFTLTGGNVIQQSGTFIIKNAVSDSNGLKISQESSNESRIFNHYTGPITFGIANTEKIRIDSGGRLLVGNTSSQSVYATAQVQIQGTDGNASSLSLLRHGNSPYLILGSSAGSSLGAVNALSNGNRIGQITFAGADGTDVNTHSASIAAYVDGSVSSNSVPADIAFQFGTSETQKVVIKNSGTIELKAANAQFKSESTSSGDWVRMYAGAGTGQWDIYGNGDHLRFTDNSNAGAARFDSRIGAGTHPSHAQLVSYFSGTASYPPSGGLVQNDNDSHGLQVWNGSNSAAYSALKLETKTTLASIWLMSNVYNSNYSGDLTFITRTGGSSNAERVRFRRDGGITFNGDTAAANALDDYEEGTFSATASAAGYSGGSAISMSDEKYTKIGRIVHFNMRLSVASNLSDGDLTITNLPFSAVQESVVDFSWQDAASFAGGQGKISGTSCVRFGGTFPTHSSGTANIIFSGTYIAS